MNGIPRRQKLQEMTTEERAIYDLVQEIEKLGCDVRLTNCINHLHDARNSLGDWVDGKGEF
jgi:hypothetical protein